jgi:hypothetical protein
MKPISQYYFRKIVISIVMLLSMIAASCKIGTDDKTLAPVSVDRLNEVIVIGMDQSELVSLMGKPAFIRESVISTEETADIFVYLFDINKLEPDFPIAGFEVKIIENKVVSWQKWQRR